jgi:hypothetical protein
MGSEGVECDKLLELQDSWVPENDAMREFLRYTREQR